MSPTTVTDFGSVLNSIEEVLFGGPVWGSI